MNGIQLLQKLIQIPSPSGHEEKIAEYILNYCKDNNINAKIQEGNVIIHLEGKDKHRALIFNAHLDTVEAGNRRLWKYPPTGKNAGKLIDGKMYGLGASDDKAAIASMLLLSQKIKEPPVDIWITLVTNEELDGSGTKNFLEWFSNTKNYQKYQKIAAIIGEPTDLSNIEIGHRGNVFITLTSKGVTGHSAASYSPDDLSVVKMLTILSNLQKTSKVWQKKYKDKILGEPNLNITGIHTQGKSYNKIPNKCWATLDIRTTPKMHDKLDQLLIKTIGKDISILRIKGNDVPGITPGDSLIIRICQKIFPQISYTSSLGATDLSQFLHSGVETIVLGPGNKSTMHKENEYVEVKKINKAVEMYQKIISEFGNTS